MKITVKRNKRSLSVSFKAESGADGVSLKDALLAAIPDGTVGTFTPAAVVDNLGKLDYHEVGEPKRSATRTEFTLKQRS